MQHLDPALRKPFGEHLRFWRQHRRMSQLDLAVADASTAEALRALAG